MPSPFPIRRRRAKALLATGLVLLTLFILSTRLMLGVVVGSHHALAISAGSIVWGWTTADWAQIVSNLTHAGPFFLDRNDDPVSLWFSGRSTPVSGDLGFPLSIPILATLIPGIILSWRTRHRPGHCRRCDYDLAGLEHDKCPECGHPISKPK